MQITKLILNIAQNVEENYKTNNERFNMTLEEFKDRILKAYPDIHRITCHHNGSLVIQNKDGDVYTRKLEIVQLFPEIDFSEPIIIEKWEPVTADMKPGTIINVVDSIEDEFVNAIILRINDNNEVSFIREDGSIGGWQIDGDSLEYLRYKPNLEFKLMEKYNGEI